MIEYTSIRNKIVSGLYNHVFSPIVPAEQTERKPPYPYISYKFISLYIPETGLKAVKSSTVSSSNPLFDVDIQQTHVEQPMVVLSLTAISKEDAASINLIHRIRDWFTIQGYDYLKQENIVVVEASPIRDRNSLIVDDYEQKYGFDVRVRVLDEVVVTKETIEVVHTHHFKE